MGIPMAEVTKPRNKEAAETAVQMNFRLTEFLRWKIYRFAKSNKMKQSEAARHIFEEFFKEEDHEGDWRGKKS